MPITLNGDTGITTPGLTNTGSTTLVSLTTTGNTILGDQSTDTLNVANGNLVLNSSGNLGIGTASPARRLQVNSGEAVAVRFTRGGGIVANNSLEWFDGTNGWYAGVSGSNFWGVAYNSSGSIDSAAIRLDTAGNLGLGVTPSSKLTVASTGSTIELKQNGTGSATYYVMDNTIETGGKRWRFGYTGGAGIPTFSLFNQTDNLVSWVADASGNFGIGTASPAAKLQISSGSGGDTTGLRITRTDAGGGDWKIWSTATVNGEGAGKLIFGTSANYMTLDGSGNLGIGTTGPTTKLDVRGTSASVGSTVQIVGNSVSTLLLGQNADGGVIRGQGGNNALTFWTGGFGDTAASGSGTERARIDSGGVLLVNRTSYIAGVGSACKLQVLGQQGEWSLGVTNGGSTQPYGILMGYGAVPNTANWPFFLGADSAATRFSVYSNGGIANYSANDVNLSDRREKKNFAPAKSYLDVICSIPVQTFNYIDQNMEDDDGLTLGVVAQDVQAVAPELVMESNWANKDEEPKIRLSVYQTDLQYALMKCIQELKSELDSVKTELAALKGN